MGNSPNFKGTPGLAAIKAQYQAQREAALSAAADRLSEAERDELRAQIVTPPVRRRREATTEAPPAPTTEDTAEKES